MSELYTAINNDLKNAMREKNELTVSVLRMLIASLKNKLISLVGQSELSDDEVMAVVKSEVKKRKDSIEAYLQGGRNDLAEKEEAEIAILNKYLPAAMSEEELEKIVREVIATIPDASAAKFGQIIGQVMAKAKGADGSAVSAMVKKVLA